MVSAWTTCWELHLVGRSSLISSLKLCKWEKSVHENRKLQKLNKSISFPKHINCIWMMISIMLAAADYTYERFSSESSRLIDCFVSSDDLLDFNHLLRKESSNLIINQCLMNQFLIFVLLFYWYELAIREDWKTEENSSLCNMACATTHYISSAGYWDKHLKTENKALRAPCTNWFCSRFWTSISNFVECYQNDFDQNYFRSKLWTVGMIQKINISTNLKLVDSPDKVGDEQ